MGMRGVYIRTDDTTIANIKNGTQTINDTFGSLIWSWDEPNNNTVLHIDKTWDVIHYTLAGERYDSSIDNPLSKVICSDPISEEDMGMGPATLISSDEVPIINNALKTVSKEWFREKFSHDDMRKKEIYCTDFIETNELFEYAYEYLEYIKEFFEQAAAEKQNILFFVN